MAASREGGTAIEIRLTANGVDTASNIPDSMRRVPFALPEYDRPFDLFVHETVTELARQRSPLLSKTKREASPGTGGSVVDQRDGEQLDLSVEPLEYGFSMDVEAVRRGDYDALTIALDSASDELAQQQVALLISTMQKVTDHTGQVTDAGGELSFEAFYEALEKLEWSLTDTGELSMPEIVMEQLSRVVDEKVKH
jgi:hypothetical protein